MKETELKPCPFCGGEGRLNRASSNGGFGCNSTLFYVSCLECGARGGKADSYFDGDNAAILAAIAVKKWNRR